jgi:hypothetical protein
MRRAPPSRWNVCRSCRMGACCTVSSAHGEMEQRLSFSTVRTSSPNLPFLFRRLALTLRDITACSVLAQAGGRWSFHGRRQRTPRAAVPDPESTPTVATNFEPSTPPPPATKEHSRNYTWSELMKRVFLVDVLQCEICGGGAMKIIAAIHSPDTARKILECLGLPTRPPPLAPAVADSDLKIQ